MDKISFSNLSKKEKIIAYVAATFVILAFFDRLVFQAILSKASSLEQDIRMRELLIKKSMKILAQKKIIDMQEKQYSVYSVAPKSQEEEISSVLKEIEKLASESSVNLLEIKPAELKSEKILRRYTISLVCEATMEQLVNFFYNIENSKVLFSIDNYSLSLKDKEKGILKIGMTISKIIVL